MCVATKTNYVEILNFRHFFKHIVFTSEGDKIRNKEIKNYINVNGLRPEFKDAMDSYEAFFDEYVAFMNTYAESDGSDLTLLSDYTSYMGKYADMMADFEQWESEEMNTEEATYYIEVQSRINQKLLEVAQ